MTFRHTPECLANHMGLYACESNWIRNAVQHIKAGRYPMRQRAPEPVAADGQRRGASFQASEDGIALIPIVGPMFKGFSKFSEANTIEIRRAIREAAASDDIRAILLRIDSPGGTVAGTADLAEDVRAAAAKKPAHAFIEDLGASAAFWVASQASHISATATTEIGSIGTVAVVEDTSGAAEMAGVTVHVVSTGSHKGAFADGAPVTPEHIADMQRRVDDLNSHFLAAVGRGRNMNAAAVRSIADGRVWIASEAKALGLIDAIETFDEAVSHLRETANAKMARETRRRRAAALLSRIETGG